MFETNEDGKMYCRPAYKCGICGKEYEKIADRMNCEMKCVKNMEEEEKKAAEAKAKAAAKKAADDPAAAAAAAAAAWAVLAPLQ